MDRPCSVEFVNETDEIVAATSGWDGGQDSCESDDGVEPAVSASSDCDVSLVSSSGPKTQALKPKPGKKTRGRVKIEMKYIKNKIRRYTTFSKRKTGIMKKAYELSVLTGTQVMLLVASETGHVYTFATRKLHPMITSENGKALIQTCLCTPDSATLALPSDGDGPHIITSDPPPPQASFLQAAAVPSVSVASKSSGGGCGSISGCGPDQKIGVLSSTFSAVSGSAAVATEETRQVQHQQQVRLLSAAAATSELSDVRSLNVSVAGHFVASGDVLSHAAAATTEVPLSASDVGIDSTIAAVDLRHQGTPGSGLVVMEPRTMENNNAVFGEINVSPLQQPTKQPPCLLYRLPGTNQFLPIQMESSTSIPVGEMHESAHSSICGTLSDHQSSMAFVNVGGTANEDAMLYSAGHGIVFATSSAAMAASSLPTDGYILNIPGTPAFTLPQELASHHMSGKADQFFTIPISSHSQLLHPALAQSSASGVSYVNGGSPLGIRSTLITRSPLKKDNS